jgi:DNA primase
MIDTTRIKQAMDMLSLIGHDTRLKRIASTKGGEYAGPCPFCGGRDRFHVQPSIEGGGRWFCRNCTNGNWQDAITYVMRRDNLDFLAACERLGATFTTSPNTSMSRRRASTNSRPLAVAPSISANFGPPSLGWQNAARRIIDECEAALWNDAGTQALSWLKARGLSEQTLLSWHIGYCSQDGEYHGLFVPRGVVIPWIAGDIVWKLNVRRPAGMPKYTAVKGSRTASALFGVDKLTCKPDCFVTEGEFDALLLWQEIGGLADVITLGSETGRLADRWLPVLLPVKRFWVTTDNDEAGERAAAYWIRLVGRRGQRILPPGNAKDVTEAWQAGDNLTAWASDALPTQINGRPSYHLYQEFSSLLCARSAHHTFGGAVR